ncbi:MAG: LysM peptidoglycan-binding domain-containing protein [Acidimicrobiales bacterium]
MGTRASGWAERQRWPGRGLAGLVGLALAGWALASPYGWGGTPDGAAPGIWPSLATWRRVGPLLSRLPTSPSHVPVLAFDLLRIAGLALCAYLLLLALGATLAGFFGAARLQRLSLILAPRPLRPVVSWLAGLTLVAQSALISAPHMAQAAASMQAPGVMVMSTAVARHPIKPGPIKPGPIKPGPAKPHPPTAQPSSGAGRAAMPVMRVAGPTGSTVRNAGGAAMPVMRVTGPPGPPAGRSSSKGPPAGRSSSPAPGPRAPASGGAQLWTVRAGESLWSIATEVLQARLGVEPTDEAIAPYWLNLVRANAGLLARPGDPSLILPGQLIRLPPVPAAHGTSAVSGT